MSVESIITKKLDVWTSAIKTKTAAGRGSSNKLELYGIKKLRELILELAVQGKLVAQNKNDKPAIQFLKDLEIAKVKLIEQGSLKKVKPLALVDEVELPFSIPKSWHWERLGNLGNTQTGSTPPKANQEHYGSDIPFIKPADISDIGVDYDSMGLTFDGANKLGRIADEHSVLMVCIGTIGKCQLIDRKCSFNQQINSITPYVPEFGQYLYQALRSPYFSRLAWDKSSSTTIAILNKGKWESIPVPVPPLEEQKRIVVKVEELMALCDQLESQTESSIEAHQTLVKSLLETLTNAKDADELNESWQRIGEHFDVLFTTEDSIDQLKQTILQLAVMGKLVKQDPNDEPASKLLERIAAEKEQLIKDKKIKKQKPLPATSEDEKPFQLPHGWAWTRFSDFVNEVATGPFGSMIHKSDYIDGGIPLINPSHMINGKIQEDSAISVNELKAEELSSYKLAEGDLVMARRGEMGRSALVTKRENNWLCGTGSFVLKFNDKVSREFLLLLFKTDYVKNYLGGNSVGSTMTNLNHGILNKMPFLIPPVAEQERIVQKVKILFGLCDKLKLKINDTQLTKIKASDLIGTKGLSSL